MALSAVREMLPVPVRISHVIGPVAAAAAPGIPLLFVAFPAHEIFHELVRLLF